MARSFAAALAPLVLLTACLPATAGPDPSEQRAATEHLAQLHDRYRVDEITSRHFTHAELWRAIEPLVGEAVAREEIGRSAEGRPIYALRYGSGPVRVMLWSQMHGDESTATMALADIFHMLATDPAAPLGRRLGERLTILAVPMLNPDGAERFQRRNAYGVDVNRDARALATPEARALREAQRRFTPDFGFNLHDQNARTRVGTSDRTAAIALLAPRPDASGHDGEVLVRAQHLAAHIREAIEPLVGGYIAKYDDTFNARAFGDLMQSWGTSTVLIESGGWRDDPEKQYLRKVNFVAIVSALDGIATGQYSGTDADRYAALPQNGSSVNDLLIRGGAIVFGGLAPVRVDVAVNFEDAIARTGGRVVEVGDLATSDARDTLDAAGLFLHPAPAALDFRSGRPALGPGAAALFTLRRGTDAGSEPVWVIEDGLVRRP